MRIQDNLHLILWTILDKFLYFSFGIVTIIIVNYTSAYEFGLYSLFVFLNSWIFTVGDSFALNVMIQYGINPSNTRKVNTLALINLTLFTLLTTFLLYFFRKDLSEFFNEPRITEIATIMPVLTVLFIPRTFTLKLMFRERNMKNVFFINFAFFATITILVFIGIFSFGKLNFLELADFYLFGALASATIGVILTRNHLEFGLNGDISVRELFDFSWKITSTNILQTLPKQMDVFLIKLFFSTEIIGMYSAAKNLFRLFDEAINAIYSLLYPTLVKLLNDRKTNEVSIVINKSISFTFWIFAFITLFLITPFGELILTTIFPASYSNSLNYFRMMIAATPLFSFVLFYSLITAEGKLHKLFNGVIIADIMFVFLLLIVSILQFDRILPLGLISYYSIFGLIGLIYGVKYYNYNIKNITLAFPDTYNYLKKIAKLKK